MVEADLRGWLPLVGVTLTEDQIDRILLEAERALSEHGVADNRIACPVSAHLLIAQKG
jgi:hypothetical protein